MKKGLLSTILMVLAIILPQNTWAQEPYAVLSENTANEGLTLTFYYDYGKANRNGMDVGPFSSGNNRPWHNQSEQITNVVFDSSFANCTTLTSTAYWFYHFKNLVTIEGINNLKTDNVTDMSFMFYGCSGLTSLDVSNFKTDNVTSMYYMFGDCSGLTSLDLSNFKTDNVTDMDGMFWGCSGLTSLDLSNFKTDNVTGMRYMFQSCSGLTSLDVSNFKTVNVTSMQWMFCSCSGLTSLDVSNFNTDNVTDMSGMFYGCSGLTSFDLSSFNTSNVKYDANDYKYGIQSMFYGCSALTTIWVGDNWTTANLTESADVFKNCAALVGGKGTHFDPDHTDYTYARIDGGPNSQTPGYFTLSGEQPWVEPVVADAEPYAVLSENTANEGLTLTFYYDNGKANRNGMDVGPFIYSYDDNQQRENISSGWDEQRENITNVVFDASFANCTTLTSTAFWFYDFKNLATIEGINNLKTDNVTNMIYMFKGCSGLTSLDVSNFKTDNVTHMGYMFYGCSGLTSLDVSNFKTDNVTDMSGMFWGCSSLTSLNVSNFKTDNVKNMYGIFQGCSGLTSLDVSNFKTDNVTDMSGMFSRCSGLTSLNVSNFKTDNVMNMYSMFYACSGLTNLDVSNFKTDNVTDMQSMFVGCSGLTSLDVSNFKTDNVTDMGYMFYGCSGLTSLDVSIFKTDNVTNMRGMFYGCSGLTSLDVSNFKTDNVTNMVYMFSNCSGLTSLDVSNFKTDNVTSMSGMFSGCSGLTSLDVSNFKTDNVTDMEAMFSDCSGLTSLDVSNFKTDKVTSMRWIFWDCSGLTSLDVSNFKTDNMTDMGGMFGGCSGLKSLDLSNFKTDNVTTMENMFMDCSGLTSLDVSNFKTGNVTHMELMFHGCSGLKSLDLSSFNTSNVKYDANNYEYGIESMFRGCLALTTIWVGDNWTTANLTESAYVFTDCTALVGGKGTHYDPDHADYEYARIDGGPNSQTPGYFTLSGEQPWVEPVVADAEPYAVLSENTNEGLTLTFYYDNDKVNRNGMDVGPFSSGNNRPWHNQREQITNVVFDPSFANCTTLTNTAYWFYDFKYLVTIEGISYLQTDNVTDMGYMFSGCYSLTSLDVSGFKTDNVTNMNYMFENCRKITELDVSGFKTDNVESMYAMFRSCSSLTSLDVSHFNTEKVKTMYGMFNACSTLTSLDVSNFNTSNVTNMWCMFATCTNLESLDVTNFNTEKVTGINAMFSSCHALTSIDISNFKTNNMTNIGYLFEDCTSLTSIDVSNFNTANVTDMNYMFNGCTNLVTIYTGEGWNTEKVEYGLEMFTDCAALVGGKGTHYDPDHTNYTYARIDGGPNSETPGYFTKKGDAPWVEPVGLEPYAVLSDNNSKLTLYYDEQRTARGGMSIGTGDGVWTTGWGDNSNVTLTTVVFDESFANCTTLTSLQSWFFGYENLTTINGIGNLKTDNVTNMFGLFAGCKALKTLDLSGFNTANVTDMSNMFQDCTNLKIIYVGEGWNTANVTSGDAMFTNCNAIVGGRGTTYNPNDINHLAYAHVDGGTGNPGYLTNKEEFKMWGSDLLQRLDVLTVQLAEAKTILQTKDSEKTAISLWDDCATIETEIPYAKYLIEAAETGKDLSNCKDLVNNLDAKLNDLLERIDAFEPIVNPEPYAALNYNNTVLTFYFDDKKSERNGMSVIPFIAYQDRGWNSRSGEITSVEFDASFANCQTITSTAYWFYGFEKVKSIDLAYVNSANVTDMTAMFYGCKNLRIIYAANLWSTASVTSGSDMFTNCQNLVGGRGTEYSATHVDVTYAHVDGSIDGSGYFTDKDEFAFWQTELRKNVAQIKQALMGVLVMLQNKDPNHEATDLWAMTNNVDSRTSEVDYLVDHAETGGDLVDSEKRIDELNNLLASLTAEVQNYNAPTKDETYAVVNRDRTVMTLYHDDQRETRGGTPIGDIRFEEFNALAAIVAGNVTLPEEQYARIGNPNLLVYVNEPSLAPQGVQNIVINGVAKEIVLTDNLDGKVINNNWYCPQKFVAEKISYTREFRQETTVGTSRGWEGLTLPFRVQTITHETNGALAPFRSGIEGKPFWLRSFNGRELTAATKIEPNVAYVIAMPNNAEVYPAEYNQAGRVTFSATNAEVYETPDYSYMENEPNRELMLIPTTMRKAKSDYIYALNVGEARGGYAEGSVFVRGLREVQPFEVYTVHNGNGTRPLYIPLDELMDGKATAIEDLQSSMFRSAEGRLLPEGRKNAQWYDLQGRKVADFDKQSHYGKPQKKGIYIKKGETVKKINR